MQFINNLRAVAILMIVLGHAFSTLNDPVGTATSVANIVSKSTFIFVFIAGFLFQKQMASFDFGAYLRNKLLNVVLPYLVVSIPGVIIYAFGFKLHHVWLDMDWLLQKHLLLRGIILLGTGAHLGPLWFIPMICLFYLMAPILVRLPNQTARIGAFAIALTASIIIGRSTNNHNILQNAVYFLPAYLLGMICAVDESIFRRISNISSYLLVVVLLALIGYYTTFDVVTELEAPIGLLLALILVSVFSANMTKFNTALDVIARLSFFLFFVHGYPMSVFRSLEAKYNLSGSWQSLPVQLTEVSLIWAATCVFCIALFVVIKLGVGSKSRVLVGA